MKTKDKYKKFRLTKQRRDYDCGPTAIVNVMKLCGHAVAYQSAVEILFNELNVVENGGVYPSDLDNFLVRRRLPKAKFKTKLVNLTYETIQKKIDKLGIAVLAYSRGPWKSGHVCVIAGYNKNGLEIINWNRKKTIQTIGFDKFKKEVLQYKDATYYFFERK